MSDYITTYRGTHFYPANPEADKIHIEDIAHALSLICRGNGHVKIFFSVGEHCIRCAKEAQARGYSAKVSLACLLHDASEIYMSDVPSPFKKLLSEYQEREERLLNMIFRKFLGTELEVWETELVKQVDKDMLYYDLRELLGEVSQDKEPEMKTVFTYQERNFWEVEKEYLDLYEELQLELHRQKPGGNL